MTEAGWLGSLFGRVSQRDGQAHALEALATHVDITEMPTTPPQQAGTSASLPAAPRALVLEALGTKVLHSYLQNRHQTLYPLTLNFGSLRAPEVALLVEAMAAAMLADGAVAPGETEQIGASLRAIGAGENERHRLEASLREPRALNVVVEEIQAANLGALAYAASLMAIDRRHTVNQLYLEYLAARLALPSEIVASLNRRYIR
jgi:uncharacterized membrane protein YebE (DUF533 family)